MTPNSQVLLRRLWSARTWDVFLFMLFGVSGVFFVALGFVGGDRDDTTYGMACLAMSKAAHAMLRIYDLEKARDDA